MEFELACTSQNAAAASFTGMSFMIRTFPTRSGMTQWIRPPMVFLSCGRSSTIRRSFKSAMLGSGPMRRTSSAKDLPNTLSFGDVEVDFLRYVARRRGKPVEMTRKEFAILRLLVARPDAGLKVRPERISI